MLSKEAVALVRPAGLPLVKRATAEATPALVWRLASAAADPARVHKSPCGKTRPLVTACLPTETNNVEDL